MSSTSTYCVVGLGVTGLALIRFFVAQGCAVIGYEEVSEENFLKAKKEFSGNDVNLYFKDLPNSVFAKCSAFLPSPGVPLTQPWVQEAIKKKIPLMGELEFASQHLLGKLLVVTGTNGKSTTVTLLDAFLRAGGFNSCLKGNIGTPLITAVREPPRDFYVVEASSFQLETISKFHPHVAIVLNVSEDHLDRYISLQEYARAKEAIGKNQTGEDFFIYNADDPACVAMSKRSKAKTLPFSLVNQFQEGGFIDKNEIVIPFSNKEHRYSLTSCSLQGIHNQENMLAAILAAHVVGTKPEVIAQTLTRFEGLSHRLQYVGCHQQIKFYDDSKGTNVGAVVMSLASFKENVILILGGRDKGGDYSPLRSLIKHKVKHLVLMGEAGETIENELKNLVMTSRVPTMKEAVKKCFEQGSAGDTVLLSPACSSFDQYRNYAERGDDFKKWVGIYGKES